nr:hypothetical protein [Tanacetum cinerariifolium]
MSDTEMGLDVADTLCFHLGGFRRRMTCRWFILTLGLRTNEEMTEVSFGAYWLGSERVILDKGDLMDYWVQISSDRDFLGPAPSYVFIRDPVRRLCHRIIACSISSRGQAPEKERKSGVRLSEGHFIRYLVAHFGMVGDQGLRGLLMVNRELLFIDLHELQRLNICDRIEDTWAWVAPGPERQPDAVAGVQEAVRILLRLMRVLRLIQHPCRHLSHHLLPPRLCLKGLRGLRSGFTSYDRALLGYEEMLTDLLLSSLGSLPG